MTGKEAQELLREAWRRETVDPLPPMCPHCDADDDVTTPVDDDGDSR